MIMKDEVVNTLILNYLTSVSKNMSFFREGGGISNMT